MEGRSSEGRGNINGGDSEGNRLRGFAEKLFRCVEAGPVGIGPLDKGVDIGIELGFDLSVVVENQTAAGDLPGVDFDGKQFSFGRTKSTVAAVSGQISFRGSQKQITMSSLGELVGRTFMLGGDGGFTLHGCPQSEEGDGIVPGEALA